MSKFYIQSGYSGRETSAIAYCYERSELSYSAVKEYEGEIVVGSVEFVEGLIGQRTPLYYPSFLQEYFNRKNMKSRQQTLNELWEKMPTWAKHRYHSDALTHHIIQRCVDRGDSSEAVGWEIARVLTGEIEAMRNKLQDIAEKSSHVFRLCDFDGPVGSEEISE